MQLGEWHGRREPIEKTYLDILKLDDYVNANYVQAGEPAVNFYTAYYASQRTGVSTHSPASCLPGGGWLIRKFEQSPVEGVRSGNGPLIVNRVVIQQGATKQLVYYWFQQRGREMTNEYLVKWYLFWDSLTRRRTGEITPMDLPEFCHTTSRHVLTPWETLERDAIVNALLETGGDKPKAATMLGISRATIYRKINTYGIMIEFDGSVKSL